MKFTSNGKSVVFGSKCGKVYTNGRLKEYSTKYGHDSISVDPKFRGVLFLTAISLFMYKMISLSAPHMSSENLRERKQYFQEYADGTWELINRPENSSKIIPVICGLGITIFSWFIIYFDSHIPGKCPPSPFSPSSKLRYRRRISNGLQLEYLCTVFVGISVTAIMLYSS